jgi:hypothetical protein
MSLASDYLLVRGIIDSTVAELGFELDSAPSVQSFKVCLVAGWRQKWARLYDRSSKKKTAR